MTYQEFLQLRDDLAKAEKAYMDAWNACKGNRKRGKKLAALANECLRLNDAIMGSKWYK